MDTIKQTPNHKTRDITTKIVLISVCVAMFVSFSAAGIALIQRFNDTNLKRDRQHDINVAVCKAASSDRAALRALVIQADRQLGTPKSAGYSYYKSHPDELAAAHAQDKENLIKYLSEIKCTPAGKAYKPGG